MNGGFAVCDCKAVFKKPSWFLNNFKTKFVGHYIMCLIVGIVIFLVIEFLGTNIIEWIICAM